MRDFNFQEPAARYCADCGKQINPRAEICPHCGVRQFNPRLQASTRKWQPNRVVAGLLAIMVVGGLGAHNFYMGRIARGLVYIIFAFTLIPFVVATVEGIRYFLMSDENFEDQYWH